MLKQVTLCLILKQGLWLDINKALEHVGGVYEIPYLYNKWER